MSIEGAPATWSGRLLLFMTVKITYARVNNPHTTVSIMNTLTCSLALMLTLTACGKEDPSDTSGDAEPVDTGDAPEVDPISDAPGCGTPSVSCNAFIGPLWVGQEETSCQSSSEAAVAQGLPALEYYADGCPDGAFSECSGLVGTDQDGNPAEGAEYTTYYYGSVSADGAAADCETKGGTYLAY